MSSDMDVQINVYKYLQALQVGGASVPKVLAFQDLLLGLRRDSFHMLAA